MLSLFGLILFAGLPPANAKTSRSKLPSGFVYLKKIAPTIAQDMRYASTDNFTGRKLPGYGAGECILHISTARALQKVQKALKLQGYGLMVYDCYRPARAVRAFAAWAHNPKATSTKDYYPRINKNSLFRRGYIAKRSAHSIGSTVDLTLVKLPIKSRITRDPKKPRTSCILPQNSRNLDQSVFMGTRFDCFDVLSHTNHPLITGMAHANRRLLRSFMARHGFKNYAKEWWHYSYTRRSLPRIYHNFVIAPHRKMNK